MAKNGIFQNFKKSVRQAMPNVSALNYTGISKSSNQKSSALDPIKKSVTIVTEKNLYLNFLKKNKIKIDEKQLKSAAIYANVTGSTECYKNVAIFNNTIDNMVSCLTNEVFSDLKILNSKNEEIQFVEYNEVQKTLDLNMEYFKKIFYNMYIYTEILLVGDDIYLPFQYVEDNDLYFLIDLKNSKLVEVNGIKVEFDSKFYNKLETILTYDVINSVLIKESILNQSRIFIDKKMFSKNVVYDEIVNLIDVPNNEIIGSTNDKSKYIDIFAGKNSLADLIATKREVELNLVNSFKLSKKTLGIDSGGQDFASSLPYENDMTAKTINNLRSIMKNKLVELIFLTTNRYVNFEFGRYQLTSFESIININQKALMSNQMSIQTAVSKSLDLPADSDEVLEEVVRIKIEKNITLTMAEDLMAQSLGIIQNDNEQIGDDDANIL